MSQTYYAVAFAGRVLHVDNNIVRANSARDKFLENSPIELPPERVIVKPLPYPEGEITVESSFTWINSLLSGEALDTIIDQEVA